MSFAMIGHGPQHVRLATDDGHMFVFSIVVYANSRSLMARDVEWSASVPPSNRDSVLAHATQFASLCAQDYGLM